MKLRRCRTTCRSTWTPAGAKARRCPTRPASVFEAKFQRPFDDVRIHDDAGADDAARKIDALAFTRGNDIYFRSGAYDPTSQPGKKLLAHELAHVVQQRPGVNRKTAPGLGGSGGPPRERAATTKKKGEKSPEGTISGNKIVIDKLRVPEFKVKRSGSGPFTLRKGTREANPTKQASVWRSKAKEPVLASVTARIKELREASNATQAGDPAYYLQLGNHPYYLIGTESSIANDIRVPHGTRKASSAASI